MVDLKQTTKHWLMVEVIFSTRVLQILNRLNTVCGMTQLSSLIDDAENKDIDEQLQKRHKEAIKAWDEMSHKFECDIKDIKDDVSQLNKRVHDIETRELECQQRKLDNETGKVSRNRQQITGGSFR